jgi:hypothetical protein
MKIKGDFVTNSSSTNFFFVFKGPRCVKSVGNAIWNHKNAFSLFYELDENNSWRCNAQDIVEDIERCVKQSLGKNEWNSVKITTLDKKISEVEEYILNEKKSHKEWMKDYPEDRDIDKIEKQVIRGLEGRKSKFQNAKDKGFVNILEMEWGDNHGHVSGGNTGNAMDYEGRRIKINSDDLIVFTEQNR